MEDWKKELSTLSTGRGGEKVKKCGKCGKPLRDPKFDLCYDCAKKSRPDIGAPREGLKPDYLQGGYFDENGYLKERYIIKGGDADSIAKRLGLETPAMTNNQLRRFYGHVRAAENRLRMTNNFSPVYLDLKKLEPLVAEAKGKRKIPDIFYDFMTKNLDSVKTKEDFIEGFMEHFQAIVGFFTFHHPKK